VILVSDLMIIVWQPAAVALF